MDVLEGFEVGFTYCPGKQLCDAENYPMIFLRAKCEKFRHCDWSPGLWHIFSDKCKQGTAENFVDYPIIIIHNSAFPFHIISEYSNVRISD